MDPSEDQIYQVRSIISVERSEAIARLKENECNPERAINEFFEGDSTKYRWDEAAFASDRDGKSELPSFRIDGSEETGPYQPTRFDSAPSRPPSRTSQNKSPLSNVIDLTAEHAPANPNIYTQGGNDYDLQRALLESRELAGLPPRVSGVTSTSEVQFGPANREQYEQGRWEMIPIGNHTSQSVQQELEPALRKRDVEAPAFLRSSYDDHRLGAILTIYHEIPLARELFLDRMENLPSYGYDSEWWKGRSIEEPVIHGPDGQEVPREDRKFTHELQRLMAFLDKTDRSYGSIDALVNTTMMQREQRTSLNVKDVESVFFSVWNQIYSNQPAMTQKLFSRGVVEWPGEPDVKDFAILDLRLPGEESDFETLYDVADEIMWPRPTLEFSKSAYLSHIADVVAFRIEGQDRSNPQAKDGSKSIDIPLVWYPDRYLQYARQAALNMRLQKEDVEQRLRRVMDMQAKLTHIPCQGTFVTIEDLVRVGSRHDRSEILGLMDEDSVLPMDPGPKLYLTEMLQKLVEDINKRLQSLEEEKQKARELLRQHSRLLTEPSHDLADPALHRYTLRGISTTKNTTYVCRSGEPDLIDMGLEDDGHPSHEDQWWSLTYGASESKPIAVEKTTAEVVLQAAKTESKQIILVYASEKAMGWTANPASKALETFVRADNQTYNSEFTTAAEMEDPQFQTATTPRSPGKRKFEDDDHRMNQRWGGAVGNDSEETVTNLATELDLSGAFGRVKTSGSGSGSESAGSSGTLEVIAGVDPLVSVANGDGDGDMGEMRERSGGTIFGAVPRGRGTPEGSDDMMVDDEVRVGRARLLGG